MTLYRSDPKAEKYLRTRATISPWKLEGCRETGFQAAIVIPALAEADALPATLRSLERNPPDLLAKTLIIVVVNNRTTASPVEKAQNQRTLLWLQARSCARSNLAWVDAASSEFEFPVKEGVGLARKIGCDLALERLDWAQDPLLISLDADTLVDGNYLQAIFAHFQTELGGAAYLPFRHQAGESQAQESAIREYELYLRSYRFGLAWAGSPYAFISIGSALACRARAYVAAGGMKRRQAGEDFYFLQQLVKTTGVSPLVGTLVRPAARYSDRVPFGTGRCIEAKVEEKKSLYLLISRDSFLRLKSWLETVEAFQAEPACVLLAKAAQISPVLGTFMAESDFSSVWQKLQRQAAGVQFMSAWHNWFDGLKTRQLLTRLEHGQAESELGLLVSELLEAGGYPDMERCSEQLELLENLQGVPPGNGGY